MEPLDTVMVENAHFLVVGLEPQAEQVEQGQVEL
jgi:hypothetical protein